MKGYYDVIEMFRYARRRGLPLLLMVLLTGEVCCRAATCCQPPAGLVGWWRAEGNANDMAGGNNGTLQGGAGTTSSGMVGTAFGFDGTNGFVQIPDAASLKPANLTIEAWVNFNSLDSALSGIATPGEQYIVFKSNSESTSLGGYSLEKHRAAGGDAFMFSVASSTGTQVSVLSATTIVPGVWYHIAGVRGPDFIQIYVNGTLAAQTNISFPQDYGTLPVYFGTSGVGSRDGKLSGLLDEVSLYNRALSSSEIAAVYFAGSAGKCTAASAMDSTVILGLSSNDSRGVLHVPVVSSFQGYDTNDWRILLPDSPTNLPRQFLYLLPVGGESLATTAAGAGGGAYGDNVEEALRVDLANRYNAVVICPSFSQTPWYANHPTDPTIQQESYFIQTVPVVESLFSLSVWTNGHPRRLLAGFSKSGWGACSLMARHASFFDAAVPWDAPLTDQTLGGRLYYGLSDNDTVFGSIDAYWAYQINVSITNNVAALRDGREHFGLLNLEADDFATSDTPYIRDELNFFTIPNTYWIRPDYLHRWYSGWVDDAARYLNQDFVSVPPALAWVAAGPNKRWSNPGNWSPGTNNVSGAMISFDNTGAVGTRGTMTSEVFSNLTISSLLLANAAASPAIAAHTIQIDPGVSLVVTGNYNGNTLEVGQLNDYLVTDVAFTGAGTLRLDNSRADLKVRSEIADAAAANTPIGAELDMSGLARFDANVRDVLIGSPSGYNTRGDLTLAVSNTITANRVLISTLLETSSFLNLSASSSLNLGPANIINADTLNVGYGRSGWGLLQFAAGLNNPTFTLRGTAGGLSRSSVNIGYGDVSLQQGDGTFDSGAADLSDGSVDLLIDTMFIGSTFDDNVTGALVLGNGSVDVNALTLGQVRGSYVGVTAGGFLTNNGATLTARSIILSDSGQSGCVANAVLTLNGGALLFDSVQKGATDGGGTTTINLNGGTLAGLNSAARTISLPLNFGPAFALGQLAGGTGSLNLNGAITLITSPALAVNVPVTIAGVIGQTGGTRGLGKSGAGTLTLSAANSYTGPTTISNGTLVITGSINGPAFVEGGMLSGTGVVNNNVTVDSGIQGGSLQVRSNFTLGPSGTLQMRINGTTPITQYDRLILNGGHGTATLAGGLQLIATNNLSIGAAFTIISNTGPAAIVGSFAGLAQNATFYSSGYWWRINYSGGSGNDVVLTTIPPVVVLDSTSLVSESCLPTNDVIDPGETVTLLFALRNQGTNTTGDVVATLLATNGVLAPSGPASYGSLISGGPAVSQPFTFTAAGACGTSISAVLNLQDGATSLGTISVPLQLGQIGVLFTQSFDSVTAPALPAGWSSSASGGQSAWVTESTNRDTVPNAIVARDPASVGLTAIVSPAITLPAAGQSQLSFRSYCDLEDGTDSITAFDGGVMDIQVGTNAFQDILAAGGSFISGGYNRTISTQYQNPLAGRQAWGGRTNAFRTVLVNLPVAAAGQSIHLRWSCGTDTSNSGGGGKGWYIDSVVINGATCCGSFPIIVADSTALVSESCLPTNNAIDPGETVTVLFSLRNQGTGATSNLVATLLATNGILAPAEPVSYGSVVGAGPPVSRAISFTAAGICGSSISATLQLQDGAASLGTVSFPLQLGHLGTLLSQNFDGVTAPALPTGWTSSASGGQSAWVTEASTHDTAPNAVFAPDAASVGLAILLSPPITLPAGPVQLSFENYCDLEDGTDGVTTFDGGVLEIQIGTNMFQDILDSGGSFVTGGYNRTVSDQYQNPLGGRQAWGGSASGFSTTVVNLPATAAGQTIYLRWSCGTDNSNGAGAGSGWFIDSISITGAICCQQTQPGPQTISVSNGVATITCGAMAGHVYRLQFKTNLNISGWTDVAPDVLAVGPTITLTNSTANSPQGFYRVLLVQ